MKTKGLILSLAIVAALGVGTISTATASGIPVVDVANIAEAVRQYEQLVQQLDQLKAQLSQAQQQYANFTGTRNLASLARGASNEAIPTNWQETLQSMSNGKISQLSDQLRESASQLNESYFDNVSQETKDSLNEAMSRSTKYQAANQVVFDSATDRSNRLTQLADAVDSTTDMKGAVDLQNRLASEQAMLLNELVKLQAMNAIATNQAGVSQEAARQKIFKTSFSY